MAVSPTAAVQRSEGRTVSDQPDGASEGRHGFPKPRIPSHGSDFRNLPEQRSDADSGFGPSRSNGSGRCASLLEQAMRLAKARHTDSAGRQLAAGSIREAAGLHRRALVHHLARAGASGDGVHLLQDGVLAEKSFPVTICPLERDSPDDPGKDGFQKGFRPFDHQVPPAVRGYATSFGGRTGPVWTSFHRPGYRQAIREDDSRNTDAYI